MQAKPQALYQRARAEEMTKGHVWQRPGQKPSKENGKIDGTQKEKTTRSNQPGTEVLKI